VSTIPAALDALVSVARAALPDVDVFDGQPAEWLPADFVVIGWTMERIAVTADLTRESAGTDDREGYDIACYLNAFSGGTTMKQVRDRVFAMYAALTAELRRDQTLGGIVMRARPTLVDYDQVQVDGGDDFAGGASATITALVHCDAFDY
jgi:hypothetical protein